jgi:hypothetical protein
MCRGYYTRTSSPDIGMIAGSRTADPFDSDDGTPGHSSYRGQGATASPSTTTARLLQHPPRPRRRALPLRTRLRRPGQEVWMVHEAPGSYGANGSSLHDARTGAILLGVSGKTPTSATASPTTSPHATAAKPPSSQSPIAANSAAPGPAVQAHLRRRRRPAHALPPLERQKHRAPHFFELEESGETLRVLRPALLVIPPPSPRIPASDSLFGPLRSGAL